MENMRPKVADMITCGKSPTRPKSTGKLENTHRIKRATVRMKRQRRK